MKKKIKMICILKNGHVVKDAFRMTPDEIRVLNQAKKYLEDANTEGSAKFTFGKTTITVSEIAAISFKN